MAEIGHEVLSVYDEARGSTDDEILKRAFAESWILITNDRDFGELVFREHRPHHGVVFLRLEDERTIAKISALEKLLENYADRIPKRFVVVTDSQVRFAD